MIRYLIDTNIYSYFVRGGYPAIEARVTQGLEAKELALSAVSVAEVLLGIEKMDLLDKRRAAILHSLEFFPVLHWTKTAAQQYAKIGGYLTHIGRPIGNMDTMIAAHALAEKLTLVTHNMKHFKQIEDLQIEDWTSTT